MRKIGVILLLFLSSACFAQVDEIYKSANDAYMKKSYEEALQLYLRVINQDYESSDLYYNIGNTYLKLNKIGKAILYYEKALKLDPNNEDASYNLKIVKAKTKDKIKVLPKLFISRLWESIYNLFSIHTFKIMIISFNILIAFVIVLFFKAKSSKERRLYSILMISTLSINILLAVMFYNKYKAEKFLKYGICLVDEYSAKVSPDETSNNAFVIHEGIKFKLEEKVGKWRKIVLEDGKVAWVEEKILGEI